MNADLDGTSLGDDEHGVQLLRRQRKTPEHRAAQVAVGNRLARDVPGQGERHALRGRRRAAVDRLLLGATAPARRSAAAGATAGLR